MESDLEYNNTMHQLRENIAIGNIWFTKNLQKENTLEIYKVQKKTQILSLYKHDIANYILNNIQQISVDYATGLPIFEQVSDANSYIFNDNVDGQWRVGSDYKNSSTAIFKTIEYGESL